jgi:hypothetical protein
VAALVNVSAVSTTETETVPHFLAGVNVTTLGIDDDDDDQKKTLLQAQLWKIHAAQEQNAQRIPPTWQRRQLSLQAATVIATSGDNKELLTLQEVSQNLPSVASTLVHVQVPEAISQVAEAMEGVLQELLARGGGGLWINGKALAIQRPSFNVFEMIQLLQQEQQALQQLERTLTPYFVQGSGALEMIQAAWSQGDAFFDEQSSDQMDNGNMDDDDDDDTKSTKHVRINVEQGDKEAVLYVNDVEKDAMYEQWPTSMQRMLMAMQYGMPPMVRRNLFTILVVDDPTDPASTQQQSLGRNLFQQLQQQFPVRMGVLAVSAEDITKCQEWIQTQESSPEEGSAPCPTTTTADGDDEFSWLDKDFAPSTKELKDIPVTARDIHRLYAYVAERYKDQREILVAYENYMGPSLTNNPPSNGQFTSIYDAFHIHSTFLTSSHVLSSAPAPADIAKELMAMEEDCSGDSDFCYGKAVRFAVDKGLKPGMSFLNGRPLPVEAEENAGERVGQIFMEEQNVIFGMVMSNDITDQSPRSVYRKLLSAKKTNVFPRVHPLLTSPTEGAYVEVNHNFGSEAYLTPKTMEEGTTTETVDAIVGVDAVLELDTPTGLAVALKFLSIMESIPKKVGGGSVSVAYRIIPSTPSAAADPLCPVLASAKRIGAAAVQELLELKQQGKDMFAESSSVDKSLIDEIAASADDGPCSQTSYLNQELPSKNFVVSNGRVFNIEKTALDTVDLELLLSIDMEQNILVTKLLKAYVEKDKAHDAVSRTTAFLAAAKIDSLDRHNPEESILLMEKELGIEENPLRFSWNDDVQGGKLKVSTDDYSIAS